VNRHRSDFLRLVERHVDVLFANEAEITALFETSSLDAAIAQLRRLTELAVVTRGPGGSIVVTQDDTIAIAAVADVPIVDTTGAGDLYAAGFLFGLTRDAPLHECGRLGSRAAAEVIGHFGARPQSDLRLLLTQSSG